MLRVDVKPELLRWARERARLDRAALERRFPRLEDWERAEAQPTLAQLEDFAKATHAPVGYLFLDAPPVEQTPIPDFRTIGGAATSRPSPDLLDTIYVCQQRQEWYRDFVRTTGGGPLTFPGSARVADDVVAAAAAIAEALDFDFEERRRCPTWSEALRRLIERADGAGVLVMRSGVVLNNNRRRLDPQEFRGFALSDDIAPLVFINGADTKAGQMFTLAHELAHIWLGQSAVTDGDASRLPEQKTERWCNEVAAELLVPMAVLRAEYTPAEEPGQELDRLARRFKVSTLVILRRVYDLGTLSRQRFDKLYAAELRKLLALPRGAGGDFYLTEAARVSRRFARALIVNTLEGQTLYRDAFRMLGVSRADTLRKLGQSLGVAG